MKKILYLTFYFEPDLCACSFRNSPLVAELASEAKGKAFVDVLTTLPNRYSSFEVKAAQLEERDNFTIRRFPVPRHQSGMIDQMFSFKAYFTQVLKYTKGKHYDLVVASSSRLFTAFLGSIVAKKLKAPLYLDIRDIFYDTMKDVLQKKLIKRVVLPAIKLIEKRTYSHATHINLISEGFKPYFKTYNNAAYSFFPNGIDAVFIKAEKPVQHSGTHSAVRKIVYAGNIGEGQGLHKIIPQAAKKLGAGFHFIVIGDGGTRKALADKVTALGIKNVELRAPVKRNELIGIYNDADYLFVHLNNYRAFEKVLPSKIFELAVFPKPLIAGIAGFSAEFVRDNIENAILFEPCNVDELVSKIKAYQYQAFYRTQFVEKFGRSAVNKEMALTMLSYL